MEVMASPLVLFVADGMRGAGPVVLRPAGISLLRHASCGRPWILRPTTDRRPKACVDDLVPASLDLNAVVIINGAGLGSRRSDSRATWPLGETEGSRALFEMGEIDARGSWTGHPHVGCRPSVQLEKAPRIRRTCSTAVKFSGCGKALFPATPRWASGKRQSRSALMLHPPRRNRHLKVFARRRRAL
jgi:hypothetical protein